jgi:hypothetical protein
MTLPVDVIVIANEFPQAPAFESEDAVEALLNTVESGHYTQIAERRSQLEDAETLRRVRAL